MSFLFEWIIDHRVFLYLASLIIVAVWWVVKTYLQGIFSYWRDAFLVTEMERLKEETKKYLCNHVWKILPEELAIIAVNKKSKQVVKFSIPLQCRGSLIKSIKNIMRKSDNVGEALQNLQEMVDEKHFQFTIDESLEETQPMDNDLFLQVQAWHDIYETMRRLFAKDLHVGNERSNNLVVLPHKMNVMFINPHTQKYMEYIIEILDFPGKDKNPKLYKFQEIVRELSKKKSEDKWQKFLNSIAFSLE